MHKINSQNLVILFLIFWISLLIPTKGFSQNRFNELSELFESKKKRILAEIAESPDKEWAGAYSSLLFTTVSLTMFLSPNGEFAISYYNCSKPWTERVNFGKFTFENNIVRLQPELSSDRQNAFKFSDEQLTFVPVKWDEDHFLIPQNKLRNFAYAANFDSDIESFLHKSIDYGKSRKGLPNLPVQYKSDLTRNPIKAKILSFVINEDRYFSEITLNVGKNDGVIPEMFFYSTFSDDIRIRLSIDSVEETTSKASIRHIEDSDSDNFKIKKGWSFTSKHPESGGYFPY